MQDQKTSPESLPPLPCACASIRRASRAVTQYYGRALRNSGLEITQFTLLQVLSRTGERTQRDLAELLAMDSTTLTRSLAPMLKHEWIVVRPGRDRRQKLFRLTPKGSKAMEPVLRTWEHVQADLRQVLGDDEWRTLMESLDRVAQATREQNN